MMPSSGKTTAHVNLRRGPGTQHVSLRVLPPEVTVQVIRDLGDWLEVKAEGLHGFVHEKYVAVSAQAVPAGFLVAPENKLADTALQPPLAERMTPPPNASSVQRSVVRTWNSFGSLLAELATRLKFSTGAAVAVLCVESGGRGFQDGKMIIRFENHHFDRHWGKRHPNIFGTHFRYSPTKRWLEHRWRPTATDDWRNVHTTQQTEWEVFEFARKLDDHAAKLSISMGGPQIMGSNHADAGYESVADMYNAFSAGDRGQIIGFFDFLQGRSTHPPMVLALQRTDFIRFAELYNGTGNAAEYGARIEAHFDAFQQLRKQTVSTAAGRRG